jgi:hypothetical protein
MKKHSPVVLPEIRLTVEVCDGVSVDRTDAKQLDVRVQYLRISVITAINTHARYYSLGVFSKSHE